MAKIVCSKKVTIVKMRAFYYSLFISKTEKTGYISLFCSSSSSCETLKLVSHALTYFFAVRLFHVQSYGFSRALTKA